jgi:hypothetical protein
MLWLRAKGTWQCLLPRARELASLERVPTSLLQALSEGLSITQSGRPGQTPILGRRVRATGALDRRYAALSSALTRELHERASAPPAAASTDANLVLNALSPGTSPGLKVRAS